MNSRVNAIRNAYRGLRLPPGLALAVLGALLVCGQISAFAHADIDCEHETCALCVASTGDSALIDNSEPAIVSLCRRGVDLEFPTSAESSPQPTAQFIRGPPIN